MTKSPLRGSALPGALTFALLVLDALLRPPTSPAQTPSFNAIAKDNHCAMLSGNPFNDTLICLVQDHSPEADARPWEQLHRFEIYVRGRPLQILDPGEPIREWHLWHRGTQLAVFYGAKSEIGTYALYDLLTLRQLVRLPCPPQSSQLPQWAKDQSQWNDESVPESPALTEQRTAWVAKVLKKLNTIHPGMTRNELASVLTTEGGISTRFEQTYVSRDCPYFKLHIHFKAAADGAHPIQESPDDIVESLSRPYLDWSIAD